MPCFRITYKHSAMQPDYIGAAIKTAHTEDDAIKFLGKHEKKMNIVIDKRGCVLTILDIQQI